MLATANNINIIGNLRLATASLCQLHSIVGSMTFTGNDMLKRIDLPNLEISKGVVAVEDQGALELLDLFSLTEAVKGEGEGKERNTLYIYLYLSISLSLYLYFSLSLYLSSMRTMMIHVCSQARLRLPTR